jgi:RNA polymerase sigma factor (TIGR02999 family)
MYNCPVDSLLPAEIASPDIASASLEAVAACSSNIDSMVHETYERLRGMARRQLSRSPESTLDTRGLVHELYLRICSGRDVGFADCARFLAYAGRAMRHILIDRSRQRRSLKVGGREIRVELTDSIVGRDEESLQRALQLDGALTALEAEHPRAARVVELHLFAGLPLASVGEVLGVVRRTVDRDWRYARAFLISHLD